MTINKAAELEIISGLFLSAAEQMRRTLVRTAFNAVIYEVLDFGISIADAKGRMVAEAAGITSFTRSTASAAVMDLQERKLSSTDTLLHASTPTGHRRSPFMLPSSTGSQALSLVLLSSASSTALPVRATTGVPVVGAILT